MTDLESWLRENNLSTNSFVNMVGCCRSTIWKVKKGVAVDSKVANKIMQITDSKVIPNKSHVGKKML